MLCLALLLGMAATLPFQTEEPPKVVETPKYEPPPTVTYYGTKSKPEGTGMPISTACCPSVNETLEVSWTGGTAVVVYDGAGTWDSAVSGGSCSGNHAGDMMDRLTLVCTGGNWLIEGTFGGGFVMSGLGSGGCLPVVVTGNNSGGDRDYIFSEAAPPCVPPTAGALAFVSKTHDSITVQYTAPLTQGGTPPLVGAVVIDGNPAGSFTPATTAQHTFTGLTPNTAYSIEFRILNDCGDVSCGTVNQTTINPTAKTLSDNTYSTDELTVGQLLGDSVTATDGLADEEIIEKSLSDSVDSEDAHLLWVDAFLSDNVSVVDGAVYATDKSLSDSVTVLDALSADLNLTLADSVTGLDNLSVQAVQYAEVCYVTLTGIVVQDFVFTNPTSVLTFDKPAVPAFDRC